MENATEVAVAEGKAEKMTLTRALAELKSLSARVENAINADFILVTQGQGDRRRLVSSKGSFTIPDVESRLKSNLQKARDLIDRYTVIKRAVIKANAETTVTVNGETMTIAEAIEKKRSIDMEISLLRNLRQQNYEATKVMESLDSKMNASIEANLNQIYGAERSKIAEDSIKVVSDAKRRELEPSSLNPNNLEDLIEKLGDGISKFQLEVDFCLSEVNAKTTIEI